MSFPHSQGSKKPEKHTQSIIIRGGVLLPPLALTAAAGTLLIIRDIAATKSVCDPICTNVLRFIWGVGGWGGGKGRKESHTLVITSEFGVTKREREIGRNDCRGYVVVVVVEKGD